MQDHDGALAMEFFKAMVSKSIEALWAITASDVLRDRV